MTHVKSFLLGSDELQHYYPAEQAIDNQMAILIFIEESQIASFTSLSCS